MQVVRHAENVLSSQSTGKSVILAVFSGAGIFWSTTLHMLSVQVVYAKGPVSGIPDTWENRRDMFTEIDTLQEGWTVELRARGGGSTGAVDAVFYDPAGTHVGAFAAARRKALQASRAP